MTTTKSGPETKSRPEKRYDVFVCYSGSDTHLADTLNRRLSELAVETHFDKRELTPALNLPWAQQLPKNIELSLTLVSLFTPATVSKPGWTSNERNHAQLNAVPVIPLLWRADARQFEISHLQGRTLEDAFFENEPVDRPSEIREKWRQDRGWQDLLNDLQIATGKFWLVDVNAALFARANNDWQPLAEVLFHQLREPAALDLGMRLKAGFEKWAQQTVATGRRVEEDADQRFIKDLSDRYQTERELQVQRFESEWITRLGSGSAKELQPFWPTFNPDRKGPLDAILAEKDQLLARNRQVEELNKRLEIELAESRKIEQSYRERWIEQQSIATKAAMALDETRMLLTHANGARSRAERDVQVLQTQIDNAKQEVADLQSQLEGALPPKYDFSRFLDNHLNHARDAFARAKVSRRRALGMSEHVEEIIRKMNGSANLSEGLQDEEDDGADEILSDAGERITGTRVIRPGRIRYRGDYVDGLRDGVAKIEWLDLSQTYRGQVKAGQPHGFGVHDYGDGHVYFGSWSEGAPDGPGWLEMAGPNRLKFSTDGEAVMHGGDQKWREFVAGLFAGGDPVVGVQCDDSGNFFEGELRGRHGAPQRHGYGVLWKRHRNEPMRSRGVDMAGRWENDDCVERDSRDWDQLPAPQNPDDADQ